MNCFSLLPGETRAATGACPYHQAETGVCLASFSRMAVSRQRREHTCISEDYDLCGVFLSRQLRTCRPSSGGKLLRELAYK